METEVLAPDYSVSTRDLAGRWSLKQETLRRWRSEGKGPAYIKIEGNFIRYDLTDIKRIEAAGRREAGES